MTSFNLEQQSRELSRLRDELKRLNREFDDAKERAGLPRGEDVKVDMQNLPPELAQALKTAVDRATAAGRSAAAELSGSSNDSMGSPRRARRGAIAI